MNKSSNWGGKRPGAGRKPTGRKARCISLTDEEYRQVQEYIQKLREQKNPRS